MGLPDETTIKELNTYLGGLNLDERLDWAVQTYGQGLAFVTSFGLSGIVLLDHLVRIQPDITLTTVDTGFLFDETHALMDAVRRHYPTVEIDVHRPELMPAQRVEQLAPRLWELDPDTCCFVRKIVPLAKALIKYTAWITGIRRDQSTGRAQTPFIRWDKRHEMIKLALLADWRKDEVWDYIRAHSLPYNALHDKSYPSIGCTHCTRPVKPGDDPRSGRWPGKKKTECGIHKDSDPIAGLTREK